jgi:hypothetical protein
VSRIALLVLALLAGSATAQTPPSGGRQIRLDVSPAGQAVLKKYLATPDPVVQQQAHQLQGLGQQLEGIASAPTLDGARLRAVMRQQEAVEAAIKRRNNDRMVSMLGELSAADRIKFVRSFRVRPAPTK